LENETMANMTIDGLLDDYRVGRRTVREVVAQAMAEIRREDPRNVWITVLDDAALQPYLARLEGLDPASLPLYGVPFALKDNIDLAGVPTTAGCPEYAYVPERSAFVVQRLIDAGAVPLGKTNLDQFATGLVGARSPYGACGNAFDPAYVSGGSSSGSAVAVALGQVSFSLGTDTAGSGRVPAAFNNLIGVKPTRGLLSASGVVPACRTLDTVSIFAFDAADASRVLEVVAAHDSEDPYARPDQVPQLGLAGIPESGFRFGVPAPGQLQFFGDQDYASLFGEAVERLRTLGGEAVEVDFAPFSRRLDCCTRAPGWRNATRRSGTSSILSRRRCSKSRGRSSAVAVIRARSTPSRRSTVCRRCAARPRPSGIRWTWC
jgi:allophanate hydrolase